MPKDVTKNDKKEKKDKKENKHFFKDFKAELKRVIWPTPKQLVNNTVAVITIVLITAIIVLVLDLAFEAMNNYGINQLKGFVEAHNEQVDNTTTNQEENNTVENTDANQEADNTEANTTNNEETGNTTENTDTTNNTQANGEAANNTVNE